MNVIALLFALLVVAYIGSSLSRSRGVRGFGLPSGVEFVLLGAALGPSALGVVDRSTLASMAPVFVFALGWIALEQGVECGFVESRRVAWRRLGMGALLGVALALTIGWAVFVALNRFGFLAPRDRWLASMGLALVSCESTRHALRWVVEHHDAEGQLSRLISDISSVDAALPLVALGWWFTAQRQGQPIALHSLHPSMLTLAALALGVLIGLLVIALLKTTTRPLDAWGVLLGGALVGVGISYGTHLSWLTSLFAMGVTLSVLSDQRERVRTKLDQTEHAVLLPILALAGAHIDVRLVPGFLPLLPVAIITRALVSLLVSAVARSLSPIASRGGAWLGPSLMSSGALTVCIGFTCALQLPGPAGQLILIGAVVDTLIGESVGPFALRRALYQAGEINVRANDDESDAASPERGL